MKRVLLVFSFLVCLHSFSLAQLKGAEILNIHNKDADTYDFKSIAFLKEELKDVDVILLGEPFHSPEYYPIKIELVKYLHDYLGFDVLAFESGLFQMEKVNEDIKNGNDISLSFEKGLFPVWTSYEEFQKLYPFIDSLRKSGTQFDITGFDCQISGNNASKRLVDEIKSAAVKTKINLDQEALQILQTELESLEAIPNTGLSPAFSESSIKKLNALAESFSNISSLSMLHQALTGFIGHFTDYYRNNIYQRYMTGGDTIPSLFNVRDSLMALNMLYVKNHLYPKRKIIAWGANLHFANNIAALDNSRDPGEFHAMGLHLKKALGKKVFSLMITSDLNIPNTIEWSFNKQKTDVAWLNKKTLDENKIYSNSLWRTNGAGDWSKVTDGILYFKAFSLADELSSDESTFIKGILFDTKTNQPVSYASIAIDGTTNGTASEYSGEFFLKIDSAILKSNLRISSMGYKSKYISISTFLKTSNPLKIFLIPAIDMLEDVVVQGKKPEAIEIFEEAVFRIKDNFPQQPFNEEFYSVMIYEDTIDNHLYKLETVFETYSNGYSRNAQKAFKVVQKREMGDYFLKEKTYGLSQWPMIDLAKNDVFGNELGQSVFNLDRFDKINLTLQGTKVFEKDTVYIISYDNGAHGTLFISAKDFGITKHIISSSSHNNRMLSELTYRKIGNKYYAYHATGNMLFKLKVDGKKKFIKITNNATLKNLELNKVTPFNQDYKYWTPTYIPYNEAYWTSNYPPGKK